MLEDPSPNYRFIQNFCFFNLKDSLFAEGWQKPSQVYVEISCFLIKFEISIIYFCPPPPSQISWRHLFEVYLPMLAHCTSDSPKSYLSLDKSKVSYLILLLSINLLIHFQIEKLIRLVTFSLWMQKMTLLVNSLLSTIGVSIADIIWALIGQIWKIF